MTPEDRKLLQQLRDALVRSNNALNVLTATNHQHDAEIIAAADARLAKPVWIRVEDALPVVPPLYAEVAIWMVDSRFPNPIRKTFRVTDKALHQYITHWQYDIQPKPPKG